jgi:hypothetical protein
MVFQRQVGLGEVELSDFKAEPLEAPSVPLQLHCAYTLKGQFHGSKERLSGVLRAGVERTYLTTEPVEKRLTPFEVAIPLNVRSRVSLVLPEGFSVEPSPGSPPSLDARFATGQTQFRIEGRQVTLDFQCGLPVGRFKAADYAAYRATLAQVLSLLEREIALKAGPP